MSDSKKSVVSELELFVQQNLERSNWVGDEMRLCPIQGDAGFRQYFRVNTRIPMLAVWAPPSFENSAQFSKVAQFMFKHGVRVPRIFACDEDRGYLLVEDFGERLLLSELGEQSVDGYYSEAMTMLLHMQTASLDDSELGLLPTYDETMLREELNLFEDWYLRSLLDIELSEDEQLDLEKIKALLVERALSQGQVVVHRDFHSRNLMVLNDGSLATIDFQDAVIGPLSYDLVSLLKDCYISWPQEKVEAWAVAYASMASEAGILPTQSRSSFLKDFHWMGLQRHIKVLGIFSRLHLRDGKPRYLNDLPSVLEYVISAAELYPELSSFADFLVKRVQPSQQAFLQEFRADQ